MLIEYKDMDREGDEEEKGEEGGGVVSLDGSGLGQLFCVRRKGGQIRQGETIVIVSVHHKAVAPKT